MGLFYIPSKKYVMSDIAKDTTKLGSQMYLGYRHEH